MLKTLFDSRIGQAKHWPQRSCKWHFCRNEGCFDDRSGHNPWRRIVQRTESRKCVLTSQTEKKQKHATDCNVVLEDEWNVKVQANTVPWPQKSALRRASVSSFGYGGTNGHVIIESVDSLYPWYQHGRRKNEAKYDHSSKQPFLVCFSAHDKKTLSRNIQAIQAVVADYYVADIAHTLNLHRTKFSHRAFALMRENQEIESLSDASVRYGTVSKQHGGVGFLFTGQGVRVRSSHCFGSLISSNRHSGPRWA